MINAAVKLYQNVDVTMKNCSDVWERTVTKVHFSLLTEAHKSAEELEISLSLRYPSLSFT